MDDGVDISGEVRMQFIYLLGVFCLPADKTLESKSYVVKKM